MMRTTLMFVTICCLIHPAVGEKTPLITTVTAGYDSRYVLYGYRLSRHLYHADVYVSKALSERVSVWGGGWYGSLTDGTYNEIDLYTGVDYQLSDHFSTGIDYSIFNYLEVPFPTSSQAHQLAGHLTWNGGPLTLVLREQYDSEAEGHLVRGIATLDHSLTEALGLSLSAEYGYAIRYFTETSGGNHALFRLELPYQLTDALCLTPFIAHSIPLEIIDSFEEEEFYGGASISVTF